jgi:hypothetical protein
MKIDFSRSIFPLPFPPYSRPHAYSKSSQAQKAHYQEYMKDPAD